MPKIQCVVCDSESFENIDGFYYCTVCNTQSRNVCDIQLEDDETVHVGQQLNKPSNPKLKKKFVPESNKSIDSNYSTYHILNILLKKQVDDLINKGVNPLLKKVVLDLWMSYLRKVGIAFMPSNSQINLKNIRGARDRKFFEIYQLKMECETSNQEYLSTEHSDQNNDEFIWPDFFKEETTKDTSQAERLNTNQNITNSDYNDDSDEEEENKEDESFQALDSPERKLKSRIVPLINFDWIRMPHTLCILNLALLIIKSNLLITDLIRFVYDGTLSYFNINKVLPQTIEFLYTTDSSMFNPTLALPETELLRLVTSKLGQFLGLETIEIISLNKITSRFLIDLNLPNQLHGIVNLLVKKIQATRLKSNELNLADGEYFNIEELALAHIYIVVIVLVKYESSLTANNGIESNTFSLEVWRRCMQNFLSNYSRELFGSDKVTNLSDLRSLKYDSIDHRFVLTAKPYISQYRRELIKSALRAPLIYCDEEISLDSSEIRSDANLRLLNIFPKLEPSKSFRTSSLDYYISDEKMKIFGESNFKSKNFREFASRTFQSYRSKSVYQAGIEANTSDWLMEVFAVISQSSTAVSDMKAHMKMFNCINKILNKII